MLLNPRQLSGRSSRGVASVLERHADITKKIAPALLTLLLTGPSNPMRFDHRLAWFLYWSARNARQKNAMKKKLSNSRNSHCDLPAHHAGVEVRAYKPSGPAPWSLVKLRSASGDVGPWRQRRVLFGQHVQMNGGESARTACIRHNSSLQYSDWQLRPGI